MIFESRFFFLDFEVGLFVNEMEMDRFVGGKWDGDEFWCWGIGIR